MTSSNKADSMNLLLTTKILEWTNRHYPSQYKKTKQKKIKNNQIQAPLWGVIILLGGLIGLVGVVLGVMWLYEAIMIS